MKYLFILFLLTGSTFAFAQEHYTIKGKLDNLTPSSKIYLHYLVAGQRMLDSATVKDGRFTFNGSVEEPTQAMMVVSVDGKPLEELSTPDYSSLMLSKGTIQVVGKSLSTAKIDGNKINKDYAQYLLALKPVGDQYNELNTAYEQATEEQQSSAAFLDSLRDLSLEIDEQETVLKKAFVNKNPDTYISLLIMEELISPNLLTDFIIPNFKKMSNALKFTSKGKLLSQKIENLRSVAVGSIAPDFEMQDTSGNVVALSSLRGKYVLIDFWASWCIPCRRQNPIIVAAYHKFKDKNFTILGVSLDGPGKRQDWLNAIAKDQLSEWHNVTDLQGWSSLVVPLYSIKGIPQNFLLDPEGKIVASGLRGGELEDKLAELLN